MHELITKFEKNFELIYRVTFVKQGVRNFGRGAKLPRGGASFLTPPLKIRIQYVYNILGKAALLRAILPRLLYLDERGKGKVSGGEI